MSDHFNKEEDGKLPVMERGNNSNEEQQFNNQSERLQTPPSSSSRQQIPDKKLSNAKVGSAFSQDAATVRAASCSETEAINSDVRANVEAGLEAKDLLHPRETQARNAMGLPTPLTAASSDPRQRRSGSARSPSSSSSSQEPMLIVSAQPLRDSIDTPPPFLDTPPSLDAPPSIDTPPSLSLFWHGVTAAGALHRHPRPLPSTGRRLRWVAVLALLLVAAVVVICLLVTDSLGGGGGSAPSSSTDPTVISANTTSSAEPPLQPSLAPQPPQAMDAPPAMEPTGLPAAAGTPTIRPTPKPAAPQPPVVILPPLQGFESTSELKAAVDVYLTDGSRTSQVATTYGWPIGQWNVSAISDFGGLFDALPCPDQCQPRRQQGRNPLAAAFNEDISSWDMSRTTSLVRTFAGAAAFDGAGLSRWDVSRVQDFDSAFLQATTFNGDITSWNVSSATSLSQMFSGAVSFNRDVSNWDVSSVTNFYSCFKGAASFRQDMCAWGPAAQRNNALVGWMFRETDCQNKGFPQLGKTPPGPFCSTCT